MEIKSWLKNTGVGMANNGSGLRTLKLALSQKGIPEINWFLVCWQKFRKAKSWTVVIKNLFGLLGLGTLKSAVYQEWGNKLGWFFAYWYKFMEVKSSLIFIGGCGENGRSPKDHVSHKLFDELSRLIG